MAAPRNIQNRGKRKEHIPLTTSHVSWSLAEDADRTSRLIEILCEGVLLVLQKNGKVNRSNAGVV